jgi:hypothetical protein
MFSTMIGILCPEIVKSIETGIFEIMREKSSKTRAKHTGSRLLTSMQGAVDSELIESSNAARAAVNANVAVDEDVLTYGINSLLISAPRFVRASQEITPSDSVTNRGSDRQPVPSMRRLSEIAFNKSSAEEKFDEFRTENPRARRPVTATGNNGKAGIGFKSALDQIPKERAAEKMSRMRTLTDEKISHSGLAGKESSGLQAAVEDDHTESSEGSLL